MTMTENERLLVRAAATQRWSWELRTMLADACRARGVYVGQFDSPGDLADLLAMAAASGRGEA